MKMMSLFDYLGHPAGRKLGLEVAEAAREIGITPGKRFVKNPGYTGMIMTYPERFLKLYFQDQAVVSHSGGIDSRTLGEQLELPF